MTPVEVWAPAFAPLLNHVTVENSQVVFASGPWCRLCELHFAGGRDRHARQHERELAAWRDAGEKQRRRQQREQLRALNRERRLTSRVLGQHQERAA